MIGELHDTISCKYWIKFSDTLPIVFLPHLIELCLCSQFCCQFQIAAFSYLSFEQVLEFSCHTFDGVVLVLWPNLICCLASKKKASAFRMKWFWFNRWFLWCPFLKNISIKSKESIEIVMAIQTMIAILKNVKCGYFAYK